MKIKIIAKRIKENKLKLVLKNQASKEAIITYNVPAIKIK